MSSHRRYSKVDALKRQADRARKAEQQKDQTRPDWEGKCSVCGESPIVPATGMCGVCTFGTADAAGGNW